MTGILTKILADKRVEVEQRKQRLSLELLRDLPAYAEPRRDFRAALANPGPDHPRLIAEIKRASPSAGLIRADFDPASLARAYAAGGAAALSVLTDEKYFDGHLNHLAAVRAAVALPLLRKDFMLDEWQLHESRAAGADAVLLIAEALPLPELLELSAAARGLGLAVLIELHDVHHLEAISAALPPAARAGLLLGINNRNLATQTTDLAHFERLAPHAGDWLLVAESGLKTAADARRMRTAGASAMLVGESLMRSDDLEGAVRALLS